MWSVPPPSSTLSSGAVHVWRAPLEQPDALQEMFQHTLDEDERERASRFHFERHRRRFVAARGFLRALLAHYLDLQPDEVRFTYGRYGKPSLDHASGLRFNMSHSHELAVYAFVQEKEIGVDVEYIKADFATEDIARQFFSTPEVEALTSLPKGERAAAFFRCWTRKEAYIKAIGSGLSHPLNEFDVSLNEPAALLRDAQDEGAVARWEMFNLEFSDKYAGALVVEGRGHSLHGFQLP